MSVLVVGTVGIDRVETPHGERSDLLGGSASFAGLAASFHAPVSLVSVVGQDFPAHHRLPNNQIRVHRDDLDVWMARRRVA